MREQQTDQVPVVPAVVEVMLLGVELLLLEPAATIAAAATAAPTTTAVPMAPLAALLGWLVLCCWAKAALEAISDETARVLSSLIMGPPCSMRCSRTAN